MRHAAALIFSVLAFLCTATQAHPDTARESGVEAAWKACQKCRTAYEQYRATASARFSSGDFSGAADMATHAFANVFNGMSVRFSNDAGGIFVANERLPPVYLSLAQFEALLVAEDGQYDHVLERGISATLLRFVNPAAQTVGANGRRVYSFGKQLDRQIRASEPTRGADVARRFSSYEDLSQAHDGPRNGRYTPTEPPADMSTERGIRNQALRIFPWASQSEQREAWIADRMTEQLDRERGHSYSVRVSR